MADEEKEISRTLKKNSIKTFVKNCWKKKIRIPFLPLEAAMILKFFPCPI